MFGEGILGLLMARKELAIILKNGYDNETVHKSLPTRRSEGDPAAN